ncbi:glycosyltransferase family 9 protein [Aquirufa sp. A-Brett2-W8]
MKPFNSNIVKWLKFFKPFLYFISLFFFKRKVSNNVRSILVMDVHLIGDLVMLTPIFRNLKNIYPGAEITFLGGPWAGSIFKNFDEINHLEFIEVPWVKYDNKFHRYITLIQKGFNLRKKNFDLSIEVRGDIRSQLFLRLSGSKNIVSYSFFDLPYFVDQILPIHKDLIHLISFNRNIIKFLTRKSNDIVFTPFLKLSGNEILRVKEVNSYIGIHFGASLPMRRPNAELLRSWISQIANQYHSIPIVIFDTPDDPKLCHKLIELLLEFNIEASIWKGGLREFIVYLTKCEYLFCLDSAPGHIASALSIPSTVIFGPTFETVASPIANRTVIISSNIVSCKNSCDQLSCRNKIFQECYPIEIC